MGADEEAAQASAWVDGVTGGSGAVGEGAAVAFGIVGVADSACVGELVAGVVTQDPRPKTLRRKRRGKNGLGHVAVGIVGDGLAVDAG